MIRKSFLSALVIASIVNLSHAMESKIVQKRFSDAEWTTLEKDLVDIGTVSSSGNNRPSVTNLAKEGRNFIAKMDSFGLDRYFLFSNDNDIDQLVTAVMRGGGMYVTFYYFEGHEDLLKNTK